MRLHVPIQLRWSDLDAYNHVNNVEMLRILQEARIQAFWADGDDPDGAGTAVLDSGVGGSTLSLIAHQEMEYLAPVPYLRKPLDIELWIGRLGGASIQVCYEIYSPEGGAPRVLFGRASTTLVMVDPGTGEPVRIGERARKAWAAYVEEPVKFTRR
ncbi:MAG: acyl-CoA thioesterase [Naasia sp.]|jgi:acyl-CoA thioester hydrolase|uniref:acyl-CoA thioesterase n=1 Tax=Naasia sp. TaxID=2546198 RepID=UPI00260A2FD0|nr:thioesterase family protein [Naasia sp.]MCU1569675.1 acyl-CoA thioesterase [Naasia sp.]MCW2538277.1 acyl-CoA thioesterase [Frankiales bacterium]